MAQVAGSLEEALSIANRAVTKEDLIGITLDVVHLFGVEPEPVAHDLLENGLVALALGDAAGQQRDRT